MADTILSLLPALTGANVASGDKLAIADVSAGASGSSSITAAELLIGLLALAAPARVPTLGSELPTYSFTSFQDANNVLVGITALNGNLYLVVNSGGVATRVVNITSSGVTSALGTWNLSSTAASATVPSLQPDFADGNTGIGRAGADQLSLVAGGIEVARASAAVAGVSDGLTFKLPVEANTAGSGAPNVLTAAETTTVLTNEGATAENYHTLPSAAAGMAFTFVVIDTDGIRIVANTDDTVRGSTGESGAAGFIRCATIGASITLLAINATQWVPTSIIGTWTVDV